MQLNVGRIKYDGKFAWAVIEGAVAYTVDMSGTTGEFLRNVGNRLRVEGVRSCTAFGEQPLVDVEFVSPITSNQQLIAQALNYDDHAREVGIEPESIERNVFFSKASSALSGPHDAIRMPQHIRLLDYEAELGLVIGREICRPTDVTEANFHEFVAGLVTVNDVSARDVQIPDGQFYRGKSYRTFAPCGPILRLLTAEDTPKIANLRVRTLVNGETRQDGSTANLIFKPARSVSDLSDIMDLFPGDVLATGTPGGVAMRVPKQAPGSSVKPDEGGSASPPVLTQAERFERFIRGQEKSGRYLKPGDKVTMNIASPDGSIDLGWQGNEVVLRTD